MSPDGKEIWAANARDATVTIIDVATKKATQTFPIPVKGANRLKFTPDGKRVLISGLGARAGDSSLVVMDASTHKEVKQLNLGGGAAGILIAPDGSRAYVAVSTADKIAVVDLKTLEVTGKSTPANSRTDWPGRCGNEVIRLLASSRAEPCFRRSEGSRAHRNRIKRSGESAVRSSPFPCRRINSCSSQSKS